MNFTITEVVIANTQESKDLLPKLKSANQVIFNCIRERLIESNEIIYKKYLLDAYNNSLLLEVEAVTDVRPILEKTVKEFENISLYKPTYAKQFLYKENLSKGEIIIHYINTSRNFSNFSRRSKRLRKWTKY